MTRHRFLGLLPVTRLSAAVLTAAALFLTVGVAAGPAQAATVDIDLTQNGPSPQHRTIASGDKVRFVNTDSFPHSLKSSTANWSFSITVNPGSASTPIKLTAVGTYGYQGTNFDTFTGDVRIPPGGHPSPSPTASRTASPSPGPSRSPSSPPSAGPSSSPRASGRPTPSPRATRSPGPRTTVAPSFSVSPFPSPVPAVQGPPGGGNQGDLLLTGPPPEPRSSRGFGLPAALAAIALLGAGSLLARTLLAHPAARRTA